MRFATLAEDGTLRDGDGRAVSSKRKPYGIPYRSHETRARQAVSGLTSLSQPPSTLGQVKSHTALEAARQVAVSAYGMTFTLLEGNENQIYPGRFLLSPGKDTLYRVGIYSTDTSVAHLVPFDSVSFPVQGSYVKVHFSELANFYVVPQDLEAYLLVQKPFPVPVLDDPDFASEQATADMASESVGHAIYNLSIIDPSMTESIDDVKRKLYAAIAFAGLGVDSIAKAYDFDRCGRKALYLILRAGWDLYDLAVELLALAEEAEKGNDVARGTMGRKLLNFHVEQEYYFLLIARAELLSWNQILWKALRPFALSRPLLDAFSDSMTLVRSNPEGIANEMGSEDYQKWVDQAPRVQNALWDLQNNWYKILEKSGIVPNLGEDPLALQSAAFAFESALKVNAEQILAVRKKFGIETKEAEGLSGFPGLSALPILNVPPPVEAKALSERLRESMKESGTKLNHTQFMQGKGKSRRMRDGVKDWFTGIAKAMKQQIRSLITEGMKNAPQVENVANYKELLKGSVDVLEQKKKSFQELINQFTREKEAYPERAAAIDQQIAANRSKISEVDKEIKDTTSAISNQDTQLTVKSFVKDSIEKVTKILTKFEKDVVRNPEDAFPAVSELVSEKGVLAEMDLRGKTTYIHRLNALFPEFGPTGSTPKIETASQFSGEVTHVFLSSSKIEPKDFLDESRQIADELDHRAEEYKASANQKGEVGESHWTYKFAKAMADRVRLTTSIYEKWISDQGRTTTVQQKAAEIAEAADAGRMADASTLKDLDDVRGALTGLADTAAEVAKDYTNDPRFQTTKSGQSIVADLNAKVSQARSASERLKLSPAVELEVRAGKKSLLDLKPLLEEARSREAELRASLDRGREAFKEQKVKGFFEKVWNGISNSFLWVFKRDGGIIFTYLDLVKNKWWIAFPTGIALLILIYKLASGRNLVKDVVGGAQAVGQAAGIDPTNSDQSGQKKDKEGTPTWLKLALIGLGVSLVFSGGKALPAIEGIVKTVSNFFTMLFSMVFGRKIGKGKQAFKLPKPKDDGQEARGRKFDVPAWVDRLKEAREAKNEKAEKKAIDALKGAKEKGYAVPEGLFGAFAPKHMFKF